MNQLPEINVLDLASKREAGDDFVLLDVREPHELEYATLGDWIEVAPLSELSQRGTDALPEIIRVDQDKEIVVMCHHGARSAQVGNWLLAGGWTNVHNLTGGIHAYAVHVDDSVGKY